MAQNACDKMNTLPKKKKWCRTYNGVHTLPRMGYRTRNKQPNGKKNQTQRYSERRPTTISREECNSSTESK